jgi:hypothetical protein
MRGFRSDDEARPVRLADVAAIVQRETAQAWLIDAGDVTVWIPKSQAERNDDGTFTLPLWMAEEKGLV